LYFVGKSLAISVDEEANTFISDKILRNEVNWEMIVKISTKHYVLPALYCNLKRKNYLKYLPRDLVDFMSYLTELNRIRNYQILKEAKEIHELLVKKNITPVFLKGVGHLINGLYEDIAERMIGDIDFIVAPKEQEKTYEILLQAGFRRMNSAIALPGRHFPIIAKPLGWVGVEVHQYLMERFDQKELNYEYFSMNIMTRNSYRVLGYSDQLCLSIVAKQIHNQGQYFNTMNLRTAYDVLLLSQKVDPVESIKDMGPYFRHLNNFLAICHEVVSKKINFENNENSIYYLNNFTKIISDEKYGAEHSKTHRRKLKWRRRFRIIRKSFHCKIYRRWLLERVSERSWLQKKVCSLNFEILLLYVSFR